jgi:hypothetical protein
MRMVALLYGLVQLLEAAQKPQGLSPAEAVGLSDTLWSVDLVDKLLTDGLPSKGA